MKRARFGSMATALLLGGAVAYAADKPRARQLGVPFDGTPGPQNAINEAWHGTACRRAGSAGEAAI
ncbi:MAG: hypothetical protein WEF99_13855 [Thermoanaerobaculia bacterium]